MSLPAAQGTAQVVSLGSYNTVVSGRSDRAVDGNRHTGSGDFICPQFGRTPEKIFQDAQTSCLGRIRSGGSLSKCV